jgi:hypothetical protein
MLPGLGIKYAKIELYDSVSALLSLFQNCEESIAISSWCPINF